MLYYARNVVARNALYLTMDIELGFSNLVKRATVSLVDVDKWAEAIDKVVPYTDLWVGHHDGWFAVNILAEGPNECRGILWHVNVDGRVLPTSLNAELVRLLAPSYVDVDVLDAMLRTTWKVGSVFGEPYNLIYPYPNRIEPQVELEPPAEMSICDGTQPKSEL